MHRFRYIDPTKTVSGNFFSDRNDTTHKYTYLTVQPTALMGQLRGGTIFKKYSFKHRRVG